MTTLIKSSSIRYLFSNMRYIFGLFCNMAGLHGLEHESSHNLILFLLETDNIRKDFFCLLEKNPCARKSVRFICNTQIEKIIY